TLVPHCVSVLAVSVSECANAMAELPLELSDRNEFLWRPWIQMGLRRHEWQHRGRPVGKTDHLGCGELPACFAPDDPGPRMAASHVCQPHVPRVSAVLRDGE